MQINRVQFIESLQIALDIIRGHRLRSGLVILGVTIGVATLMGMVATLSGLSRKIEQDVTGGDTVIIQLSKFDFIGGDSNRELMERRKDLTAEDAAAVTRIPYVNGVDINYAQGRALRHKDKKAQFIRIIGSTTTFPLIQNLAVVNGRFFTEPEMEHRRRVVVLGNRPAEELFPGEDPVGKSLRLEEEEYQVMGVFDKDESIFAKLFGSLQENFVVIPYTAYERDFKFRREPMFIPIIIDGKARLDGVREEVRALMRARRKVAPGQPDDFALITADAALEFIRKITGPIGLVLVVISSIGLMVGGIGVMVIMLVSVTERTREIGIRKALGATRREIVWQFLIEAAVLTGIGGMLGIVLGLGLALLLTRLGGFPFSLPLIWVFIAVATSAGAGLLFGIYPANRAAKLDPVDALRYE